MATGGIDRKLNIFKETKQNQWEKVYEYKEHKNSVNNVVFAPHEYGLIVLAGSSDGFISIHEYRSTIYYNIDDNWISTILEAHSFGVTCLAWEQYTKEDSSIRFVSGGNDNKLKIWTVNRSRNTTEKIFNLDGHNEAIIDVVWFKNANGTSTIVSSGKVYSEVI